MPNFSDGNFALGIIVATGTISLVYAVTGDGISVAKVISGSIGIVSAAAAAFGALMAWKAAKSSEAVALYSSGNTLVADAQHVSLTAKIKSERSGRFFQFVQGISGRIFPEDVPLPKRTLLEGLENDSEFYFKAYSDSAEIYREALSSRDLREMRVLQDRLRRVRLLVAKVDSAHENRISRAFQGGIIDTTDISIEMNALAAKI